MSEAGGGQAGAAWLLGEEAVLKLKVLPRCSGKARVGEQRCTGRKCLEELVDAFIPATPMTVADAHRAGIHSAAGWVVQQRRLFHGRSRLEQRGAAAGVQAAKAGARLADHWLAAPPCARVRARAAEVGCCQEALRWVLGMYDAAYYKALKAQAAVPQRAARESGASAVPHDAMRAWWQAKLTTLQQERPACTQVLRDHRGNPVYVSRRMAGTGMHMLGPSCTVHEPAKCAVLPCTVLALYDEWAALHGGVAQGRRDAWLRHFRAAMAEASFATGTGVVKHFSGLGDCAECNRMADPSSAADKAAQGAFAQHIKVVDFMKQEQRDLRAAYSTMWVEDVRSGGATASARLMGEQDMAGIMNTSVPHEPTAKAATKNPLAQGCGKGKLVFKMEVNVLSGVGTSVYSFAPWCKGGSDAHLTAWLMDLLLLAAGTKPATGNALHHHGELRAEYALGAAVAPLKHPDLHFAVNHRKSNEDKKSEPSGFFIRRGPGGLAQMHYRTFHDDELDVANGATVGSVSGALRGAGAWRGKTGGRGSAAIRVFKDGTTPPGVIAALEGAGVSGKVWPKDVARKQRAAAGSGSGSDEESGTDSDSGSPTRGKGKGRAARHSSLDTAWRKGMLGAVASLANSAAPGALAQEIVAGAKEYLGRVPLERGMAAELPPLGGQNGVVQALRRAAAARASRSAASGSAQADAARAAASSAVQLVQHHDNTKQQVVAALKARSAADKDLPQHLLSVQERQMPSLQVGDIVAYREQDAYVNPDAGGMCWPLLGIGVVRALQESGELLGEGERGCTSSVAKVRIAPLQARKRGLQNSDWLGKNAAECLKMWEGMRLYDNEVRAAAAAALHRCHAALLLSCRAAQRGCSAAPRSNSLLCSAAHILLCSAAPRCTALEQLALQRCTHLLLRCATRRLQRCAAFAQRALQRFANGHQPPPARTGTWRR